MKTAKKLHRTTEGCVFAGVCAGLGEYFNIDPIIFRILFVLLAMTNGAGIIIYLILMILLPKKTNEDMGESVMRENAKDLLDDLKTGAKKIAQDMKIENPVGKKDNKDLMGILIIIFGFVLFFNQIFPMHWFRWDLFWPLIVIFIGFWILFKKN